MRVSALLFCVVPLFFSLNGTSWSNWAGNIICSPKIIALPSSYQQLQEVVSQSRERNCKMRAVGSGHSWSDIACTDGCLIKTSALNRVLLLDLEKKQIKVEAGITLKNLTSFLAYNHLALPNVPAILEQSVAGALATATHGSGHTGILADFVAELQLLTADGTLHTLSYQNNAEAFAAARASLGSLGIIYSATLQCVSLHNFESRREKIDWPTFLATWQQLYECNEFIYFFFYLPQESILVETCNRTDQERSYWLSMRRYCVDAFTWILTKMTAFFPGLYYKAMDWWVMSFCRRKEVGYNYELLTGMPNPYYLEEEIAVPLTQFISSLEAIKKLACDYRSKGITIGGLLCRFVNADHDILLSPAAGRDVVYISISTPIEMEKYQSFYRDFYKILLPLGGRPHWGKLHYLTPEDAHMLYGDNVVRFNAVRHQLDPDSIFSNDFTCRVFGL